MDRFKVSVGILITVVLGVIIALVVGLVMLFTGGNDDDGAATAVSSAGALAAGESPAAASSEPDTRRTATDRVGRRVVYPVNPAGDLLPDDGTALREGDRGWLTKVPVIEWQRLREGDPDHHPVDLPFTASDGPWRMIHGVPAGYSRTPQGAALAAMWILNMLTLPNDGSVNMMHAYGSPDVQKELDGFTPNAEQQEAAAAYDGWPQFMTPRAYRIMHYDGNHVLLQMATGRRDTMQVAEMSLTWDDNDKTWRMSSTQYAVPAGTVTTAELGEWVRL